MGHSRGNARERWHQFGKGPHINLAEARPPSVAMAMGVQNALSGCQCPLKCGPYCAAINPRPDAVVLDIVAVGHRDVVGDHQQGAGRRGAISGEDEPYALVGEGVGALEIVRDLEANALGQPDGRIHRRPRRCPWTICASRSGLGELMRQENANQFRSRRRA